MLQLWSNLGQSLPEFGGASRSIIHVPFHRWTFDEPVYHLKASSTLCFEHSVKMVVMARNLFSLLVSSISSSSSSSSSLMIIYLCSLGQLRLGSQSFACIDDRFVVFKYESMFWSGRKSHFQRWSKDWTDCRRATWRNDSELALAKIVNLHYIIANFFLSFRNFGSLQEETLTVFCCLSHCTQLYSLKLVVL